MRIPCAGRARASPPTGRRSRPRRSRSRTPGSGWADVPLPQNFERAQLVIDGQEPINCAFNPQEYALTKTNVWTIKPVTGTDAPTPEFGGGMPWTIAVRLLLDASLAGPAASIKDDALKLLRMMESG